MLSLAAGRKLPGERHFGFEMLEEIIVTASARKQSMVDIPYNISAMSGTEMEAL